MNETTGKAPFIIDAHTHTGYPNVFFSPEVSAEQLLARMDKLNILYAVNLVSMKSLADRQLPELETSRKEFEESGRRIFYCGFFNPNRAEEDLEALRTAAGWPGFAGIKIHPSFSGVPADDDAYKPVWTFAAEKDLPIVAHTWSVSSYNPAQKLSTPDRFEKRVREYPQVRFVIGHSGGRTGGRLDAVRMAGEYDNVYMDFGGDVYDYQYFEKMARDVPHNKVLFGSDYPWLDQRSHLTRVYLSDIPDEFKQRILRDNALEVYKLEERTC